MSDHDLFARLAARAVEPATCATCGADCARGYGSTPTCFACAEAAAAAREAQRIASVTAARAREWRRAVPPRFAWATQDAAPELAARVDRAALSKAEKLGLGPLTLTGPSGSGKTSLAVALVSRWVSGLGVGYPADVDFVSSIDVEHAARRHRLGDDEPRAIERALEADLLVLDDLGMERSRFGVEALVRIIAHRHDQDLITVATTALDDGQLADTYGAGIARRLLEGRVLRMRVARP